jgi:hypothetical protein
MPTAVAEYDEQIVGEAHDPGDRQQQEDSRDHGQCQAENPRAWLHRFGHPADQDRDHDDVVDAQHDFQGSQG